MTNKNPTLFRLRNANPRVYAELCEKAGCYSAAFEFYASCNSPEDLLHTAHLANNSGNSRGVRKYCRLARMAANTELESAKKETFGERGGMGTAMVYASAQDRKKKVDEETSRLLAICSKGEP